MIRFACDYGEGAHPDILALLSETNFNQTAGYSEDEYCDEARAIIRNMVGDPNAAVHFLVGGTQANVTVIASALRHHEGVLCAETGHIHCHETGALEAAGHKCLALPSADGTITAEQVEAAVLAHRADSAFEHIAKPAMVYISFPTENGTLYSKAQLTALSEVCRKYGLFLFADGARMGYGLASPANDVTYEDLARLCDVFYIGGTKVGALFGEAVVITNDALKPDFRYHIKQRGGMLAKGRLLGLQFIALLKDGLYGRLSQHAVGLALQLRAAFEEKGYPLFYDSYTNQQFPILPNEHLAALADRYTWSTWAKTDEGHTAVRFCTSWATRPEDVETLIADIRAL